MKQEMKSAIDELIDALNMMTEEDQNRALWFIQGVSFAARKAAG